MANWVATLKTAVPDPSGQNSNIIVTVDFINSVTLEKQTRSWNSSNFTGVSLKALAAGVIQTLNDRDASLVIAQNAIAAGGASVILATG